MRMTTADEAAKEAMAQGLRNAREEWRNCAQDALRWHAQRGSPFTSSEVRQSMPFDVWTRDTRAMGGLFKRASQAGLIRPTGRWVNTGNVASHGRPEREWEGVPGVSQHGHLWL